MLQALITGVTMGLYLAISVGPILFTVINQSLNDGTRGGFSFVAGLWLSDILFVLISNVFTGFTAHFLEVYIKEIGYGGGVLLFGLGCYYALFKRAVVVPLAVAIKIGISHSKIATLFAKGFIINTVNPILFIEWLTAATVFAKTYTVNYRILIFSVCLSVTILSDIMKVLLAGKLQPRLTLRNLNIINRITGSVLIICGGFILYQTFYHSDKWKKREQSVSGNRSMLKANFSAKQYFNIPASIYLQIAKAGSRRAVIVDNSLV